MLQELYEWYQIAQSITNILKLCISKFFTNYNDQTCSGSDRHKQTPIYVLNIFGKFCRLEGHDCGSSTVPKVGNATDFSPKVFQQH